MNRIRMLIDRGRGLAVRRCLLAASLVAMGAAGSVDAQEDQDDGQSLEQAANDPTASLMSFQLQDFYSPNLYNSDDASNIVQFGSAVPFRMFGLNNIARLTLPFVTENTSGETGVSDTTIFDLVTFDRTWGRFGVGAVGLIPTGERGLGAGK